MAVTLHLTNAQAEILGFALLTARRDQRAKLDGAGYNAAAGIRDRLARLDQVAADLDVTPVVSGDADAGLLALCVQLRDMQAGWQRLWDATPDDGPRTPADAALRRYARSTWPCTHRTPTRRRPDPVAGLLRHQAQTPAGMQAKAAAIRATFDAEGYFGDVRDDAIELLESLMDDVAGSARVKLGEHHARPDHDAC